MIATMEDWETGPDAAKGMGDPGQRVECRVLLLYGTQAEITTPYHRADHPLRVDAAELARQLGVAPEALPSMRFTAVIDGDAVSAVEPAP